MLFKETSSSNASEKSKTCISSRTQKYNLKYPRVKRGELYICDFGEPYGSEQGYKRFALIVQNNVGNYSSPTTIVVACTTKKKTKLPVHYQFNLSPSVMKDYNQKRIGKEVDGNTILAEQIKTVDKKRLRKFVGTMTDEFMDEVQKVIDISLDLKRDTVKSVQDLSIIQIQILAKANIEKILGVSKNIELDGIKIRRILELFGFDLETEGAQYLVKAICLATKADYIDLETLCEEISKEKHTLSKEKMKAIIVTTIKEKFNFETSVAIEFIRLISILLVKQPIPEIKEIESMEYSKGKIENILWKYLKKDLEKIDFSMSIEENIDYFLDSIDMTTDEIIMQSFVIACNTKRITYAKIINQLKEIYPEKMSAELRKTLRDNFKKWLEKNPELATQCRQISIMNLLKIFAKMFV